MNKLESLLKFTRFLHKFQQVKRSIYVFGEDRRENDAEHSYQLAMTAWYLLENDDINLRRDLVLEYALVHDLVEVYAGDTAFHQRNEAPGEKTARETESLRKIEEEFPELSNIHQRIKEYEAKKNEESRFVYALDKLIPAINIYLNNGREWQEDEVTLKMILDYKTDKVSESSVIEKYLFTLVDILKNDEAKFFNS
ncbi:MAG: HD domain-containing protein [Candidatus Paceibacterota bacterium]